MQTRLVKKLLLQFPFAYMLRRQTRLKFWSSMHYYQTISTICFTAPMREIVYEILTSLLTDFKLMTCQWAEINIKVGCCVVVVMLYSWMLYALVLMICSTVGIFIVPFMNCQLFRVFLRRLQTHNCLSWYPILISLCKRDMHFTYKLLLHFYLKSLSSSHLLVLKELLVLTANIRVAKINSLYNIFFYCCWFIWQIGLFLFMYLFLKNLYCILLFTCFMKLVVLWCTSNFIGFLSFSRTSSFRSILVALFLAASWTWKIHMVIKSIIWSADAVAAGMLWIIFSIGNLSWRLLLSTAYQFWCMPGKVCSCAFACASWVSVESYV